MRQTLFKDWPKPTAPQMMQKKPIVNRYDGLLIKSFAFSKNEISFDCFSGRSKRPRAHQSIRPVLPRSF